MRARAATQQAYRGARLVPANGVQRIRAGRGLGDSIYLQSVVRHLLDTRGAKLEVLTDWPEVFRPLAGRVSLQPFVREKAHLISHYTGRKHVAGTDQFQDMCLQVGITEPVDLRLDWTATGARRPVGCRPDQRLILVQLPRKPMDRVDQFGQEVLPDCSAIQRVLDYLRARGTYLVQVGAGKPLHRFNGIGLDLANRTTIPQLLDLAQACDGVVGYPSFLLPLAESFRKPGLFVWSRRIEKAAHPFVRAITPTKVVHRKDLIATVWDDATDAQLQEAADALLGSR